MSGTITATSIAPANIQLGGTTAITVPNWTASTEQVNPQMLPDTWPDAFDHAVGLGFFICISWIATTWIKK